MFGFLKDKIKSAISNIKKEVVEEEKLEEEVIEQIEEKQTKKKEPKTKPAKKIETKKEKTEIKEKKKIEDKKEEQEKKEKVKETKKVKEEKTEETPKETIEEKPQEKKSFFRKITEKISKPVLSKKLSEEQFEKIFWDLELGMIESNVALEVIEKIKEDLRLDLVEKSFNVFSIDKEIQKSLERSIQEILSFEVPNLIEKINSFNKKPVIICFFGINGSGKTTTIAKIGKMIKDSGKNVVISASDTFRAAAIDQLEEHANKIGIKMIKHDYGADAAAVAFDTIEHAKAHNIDVVLIDTAGRSHSNANLMDELAKIMRVAKPDIKIFVGDSLTGNDMVEQAKIYSEKIGVDGLILTKTDADEKGGAIISASYITQKPILFLGTGQSYSDLIKFNKKEILSKLGLEEE